MKYISSRKTAALLGITTNALKMRRYRGTELLLHRKKNNGQYEYDEHYVNIFITTFENRGVGKGGLAPKGSTVDKFGIRAKGHKRNCNCYRCNSSRKATQEITKEKSDTNNSSILSPSESMVRVTTKHEDLIAASDRKYLNTLGPVNEKKKKDARKRKEDTERTESIRRAAVKEPREFRYIRWLGPKDMTPTWRSIHEPKKTKKYSYYS